MASYRIFLNLNRELLPDKHIIIDPRIGGNEGPDRLDLLGESELESQHEFEELRRDLLMKIGIFEPHLPPVQFLRLRHRVFLRHLRSLEVPVRDRDYVQSELQLRERESESEYFN